MPKSNNNRRNKKKHKKPVNKKARIMSIPPNKFQVEIIKVMAIIKEFNPSNKNWASPLQCRLGSTIRLLPEHPKHGWSCVIDFDIYETNLDTDFILDIPAQAVVKFKVSGKWATQEELYGCYLAAIVELNKEILAESLKESINVDTSVKAAPFEQLKDHLSKAIEDSFKIEYDENDL